MVGKDDELNRIQVAPLLHLRPWQNGRKPSADVFILNSDPGFAAMPDQRCTNPASGLKTRVRLAEIMQGDVCTQPINPAFWELVTPSQFRDAPRRDR
ncbi:hypothetical protein BSY19_4797 (plasmid) [Bosea sp. RAC05]|nr:hypothetical protein BSY19_4797 [Bosea sp. RAC05]